MTNRIQLTSLKGISYGSLMCQFTIRRLVWFSILGLGLALLLPVVKPPTFFRDVAEKSVVPAVIAHDVVVVNNQRKKKNLLR